MALHAPVQLNPGDLIQLQFPTSDPAGVNAVVRDRQGNCLGLEFLSQLPPDTEAATEQLRPLPGSAFFASSESRSLPNHCTPQTLYAGLRRKQEELKQLQKEIEVLSVAILLLADDENDICRLPIPGRLKLDTRPWPIPF
jgi:hypothetical protein